MNVNIMESFVCFIIVNVIFKLIEKSFNII